jgi:pyruvyltransferase
VVFLDKIFSSYLKMKLAALYACNDNYVPYAITGLKCFTKKNTDYNDSPEGSRQSKYNDSPEGSRQSKYNMFIIGTNFSDESKKLCREHYIDVIEIDLSCDFFGLNDRPYGNNYPVECFYHFYAYKILRDYDFIVYSEADVYTNKKLDFDFNKIKYIGGSSGSSASDMIDSFPSLSRDFDKIEQIYKIHTKQYRMSPGLRIYNVKGLHEINFYETIITYYKTSWDIGAPRCGDDSLIGMYQLINPTHFHLLDTNYCVVYPDPFLNKVNDIYLFHNHENKYWMNTEITNEVGNIFDYFMNKHIEFIYNNFEIDFIKKYIPNIYVNIYNIKPKIYYFPSDNNFGDFITPYFLCKCCDVNSILRNQFDESETKMNSYELEFDNIASPKIISCGSVMRLANNHTFVYGSGIRDINQDINLCIPKIVRGPMTQNRLTKIGCYCPDVFGDPALLLPLYHNPIISKKYSIGIIPHIIHYDMVKNMYQSDPSILIINLHVNHDNIVSDMENIIDQILSCEKILSSSLHGLIVSDTYEIPNKWIQYDDKIPGDDTKFYDYFRSVKRTDKIFIDCSQTLPSIEKMISEIKPVNIKYDIDELQNHIFFDHNGIKNYTKYIIALEHLNMYQKENNWYAFKGHWTANDGSMTAINKTFLKKNKEYASSLPSNMKKLIYQGTTITPQKITVLDDEYYLISHSTSLT